MRQCEMDRALYDLAEAACGHNSSMQWSLSDSILRRQVAPVFIRCAEERISPEDALDVAMDFVTVGVAHNIEVIEELFNTLSSRVEKQLGTSDLPALAQLQELVMGLSLDAEWATNDVIARRELYPLFVRVSVGNVHPTEGTVTFCDTICAKRAYYLELVQQLTARVAQEIVEASRTKEESTDGDS